MRPLRQNSHGYTATDLIVAAVIIVGVVMMIVMLSSPQVVLGQQYDQARLRDVQDYNEALFELSYAEPEIFSEILVQLSSDYVMIGVGDDCSGSYGLQCPDTVLRDDCLDLEPYLIPKYLDELPIDPKGKVFSTEQTGYFLSRQGNTIEIGACSQSGSGTVMMRFDIE